MSSLDTIIESLNLAKGADLYISSIGYCTVKSNDADVLRVATEFGDLGRYTMILTKRAQYASGP